MSSVIKERDDRIERWCQILFDSGERVLVSIAGKPTASIKVMRLAMGGLIPVKTVWDFTPAKVGSDDAYVSCFMKMFSIDETQWKRPLAAIRDALLQCASIEEARKMLFELQAKATVME